MVKQVVLTPDEWERYIEFRQFVAQIRDAMTGGVSDWHRERAKELLKR